MSGQPPDRSLLRLPEPSTVRGRFAPVRLLTTLQVGVMSMSPETTRTVRNGLEAPVVARERILRLLGMNSRPLRWTELQNALGLLTNEARTACEWLMDHGYIAPIRLMEGAVEVLWTLGDRGRAWATRNGALAVGQVPQNV